MEILKAKKNFFLALKERLKETPFGALKNPYLELKITMEC
jgi:hypothetical protein